MSNQNLKIEINDPIVAGLLAYVSGRLASTAERSDALRKASELAKLFWPPLSNPESSNLRLVSECPETSSADCAQSERTALSTH